MLSMVLAPWLATGENLEFYGESYNHPGTNERVDFLRFQWTHPLGEADSGLRFFAGLETTRNRDLDGGVHGETGVRQSFLQRRVVAQASVQRQHLDGRQKSRWQAKVGGWIGDFWRWSEPSLFAEAYSEIFLFSGEERPPLWAGAGFGRGGWRWIEKNHWIIDPVFAELRIADNSDVTWMGPDYRMMGIGSRLSFWWSEPTFSTSLAVLRVRVESRSRDRDLPESWVLWTAGARF